MLLKNAFYLDHDYCFKKGDIQIENGLISKITPFESSCKSSFKGNSGNKEAVFDCASYFLLPGLVNAHTHNPGTIARGIFRDMPLGDWMNDSFQGKLQERLFDYLDESVGQPAFRILCLKAYAEYIRQGITYIVETGQADNAERFLRDYLEEVGLKATLDLYDNYASSKDLASDKIGICAHFPEEESIDAGSLESFHKIHSTYDPVYMTHCLETEWRKDRVYENYGLSTVELLHREGLLSDKAVLFHCVHVNDSDVKRLSESGASVVYCPVSNLWSGAGQAPVHSFLKENINVMLGTDFIYQDLWEVMRLTYLSLKGQDPDSEYTAQDIFKMVTENAHRGVVRNARTGGIREGCRADLMFIDKSDPSIQPLIDTPQFSNVLHNLLMNSREDMIAHVMIDGKWVMKDRRLTNIDEDDIDHKYTQIATKLMHDWTVEINEDVL